MREQILINQGGVTAEVYIQLRNSLRNRKMKRAIHATLITIIINITVGNQISDSDVDQRIISSQIFRDQKLWTRNFTGARKILKSCVQIKENR